MERLIFLGTGGALATKCYNTCFLIQTEKTTFLTDTGGGNGILSQLEKVQIPPENIDSLFITHAHTDHVLGGVWLIRIALQQWLNGKRTIPFHIYSHEKVLSLLDIISRMTLPVRFTNLLGEKVIFHELHDGDCFQTGDLKLQCFDIRSTKEKQFGYSALLPDGQHLACLGDEPYNPLNHAYIKGADWLLCEAFCQDKEKVLYHPHEKHHGTVLEAARKASLLHVNNLVLYHTIDNDLPHRKQTFTEEASTEFAGRIFVPDDLETILLNQ